MRGYVRPSVPLIAAVLACLVLASPAQAATTQTFTTSDGAFTPGVDNQGWWSSTLDNSDENDNYFAGQFESERLRNFFTFHLGSACEASAVTLRLTRFIQTTPVQYSLFDVSTPARILNANFGVNATIFADLGTGTRFGTYFVPMGAEEDVLTFRLDAAGVEAFNAAHGTYFSLGGSVETSVPDADTFYIYGFSGPQGTQELVATCFPQRKEECTRGGWRAFGVFKNQGDCVSFVVTGGKNQPIVRN